MKTRTLAVFGLGLVSAGAAGLAARFYIGRQRVEQDWAAGQYPKMQDLGAVRQLRILPLIDSQTARADLLGEAGVAYLVQADDRRLLFDTGYNAQATHPSPLLHNMQALGISPDSLEGVVISHLHPDHTGGWQNQRRHSFDLSAQSVDLSGKTAYVPARLTHPTATIEIVDAPRKLAPGIASLGPVPRQLFFFGRQVEQSLAVHVDGKGLVLIIGCGHPTLERILERAEMLFDLPIYGVVGGLHYPVTELPLQRYLGTDRWPWQPASQATVEAGLAALRLRNPQLVALSAHDSCQWSRSTFRQAFPHAYREVRVGEWIEV